MMVRLNLEFPFLSLPQLLRSYTFLVQTYSKESPLLHSKDTLLYRLNHFMNQEQGIQGPLQLDPATKMAEPRKMAEPIPKKPMESYNRILPRYKQQTNQ